MNASPQVPSLNVAKFDALVHYICAYCEDPTRLGATKLNKTLWYSDVFLFLESGKSIAGAIYVKHQFGPVPKEITQARRRLIQAGKIIERIVSFHGYPQTQFIALTKPDISLFSSQEISIVDKVASMICDRHTATSISHLTHDAVWESAEIGEEIPLFAVLGAELSEITVDDMTWAMNEMAFLSAK